MSKAIIIHILIILCITLFLIMQKDEKPPVDSKSGIIINYKGMKDDKLQQMDVEDYLIGVVSAEMPVSFELEALRAQAVAARTYSIRNKEFLSDDVNSAQAYSTLEQLKKRWGSNFEANYSKIREAITSTKGEVIKYNGDLISAVYHSTSAGKTQNSADVWSGDAPYLKSVMSIEDTNSPSYSGSVKVTEEELIKKLSDIIKLKKKEKLNIDVASRYESGYVKNVKINGKLISGIEIRKRLNLKSNNFDIEKKGKNYTFNTKGYGHGVGMSQYGAQFMAKEGKTYKEIIKHYYTGVEIVKM